MPKNTAAAKSPQRKTRSQKKGKAGSSTPVVAVTSHVGKTSPQLRKEFQQLWASSMKKTTTKKVFRDGNMIITIYK